MPTQTRTLSPGPTPTTFRTDAGQLLTAPPGWSRLPPGDAGLTRRVKAAGPTWTIIEIVRRKKMSRGVWALTLTIEAERSRIEAERATPQYQQKQLKAKQRRDEDQLEYVHSFEQTVRTYLNFHPRHAAIADGLAKAVTLHATPVGSGTVARTERIPVEDRAEAAVIAWLRHQTTAYDSMSIARIKGERRAVRRELAQRSKSLLATYRAGQDTPDSCPLRRALSPRAAIS